MELIKNITDNYALLQADFIGITISLQGIVDFFSHLLILLFGVFYLIGERIRSLFFSAEERFISFINIALGYIAVGTSIAILGVFSLLQPPILILFFVLLLLVSVDSFFRLYREHRLVFKSPKKIVLKKNFLLLGVALFVLLSFLRLMTPEITEDGYHTDLPQMYLSTGTMIHETKELLHVIPYPQLPEMIYLIPLFFGDKEATRFIHFGFYLSIIFLFFKFAKETKYSFVRYAALLFVSTPLVIRYAPSQYTDFFMLFTFLLSIILLNKEASMKTMLLSGIFFGAVISSKMWLLVYLPAIVLYIFMLNCKKTFISFFKKVVIFITGSLSVVLIWYIRAFLITGNPLYPLFSKLDYLGIKEQSVQAPLSAYFGFNYHLFEHQNLVLFSPLFFLSLLFTVFFWKKIYLQLKRLTIPLLFLLMLFEQLTIQVYLARYLLAWYSIGLFVAATGMFYAMKFILTRYIFVGLYLILFFYYALNTFFMLPYGFGWADKNSYLTRVLYRDNASYYDFEERFDKHINSTDRVATYGIVSFYYADFHYVDVGYIFDEKNKSLDLLQKEGVTKLLVKGGDLIWFCQKFSLQDCELDQVSLLATYPSDIKKYNLYQIRK